MPIYTFECAVCSEEKEVRLPVADYDKPQKCENCREVLRRLPPKTSAFLLRGGGWYATEYGGKKRHD